MKWSFHTGKKYLCLALREALQKSFSRLLEKETVFFKKKLFYGTSIVARPAREKEGKGRKEGGKK